MEDKSIPFYNSQPKTLLLTDEEIEQLIQFFKTYRVYQTAFPISQLPSAETFDHVVKMFEEVQCELREKEQ